MEIFDRNFLKNQFPQIKSLDKQILLSKNFESKNLLHIACTITNPEPELIKFLIEIGVPINNLDNYSNPPIYYLLSNKKRFNEKIADLMISSGADLSLVPDCLLFALNAKCSLNLLKRIVSSKVNVSLPILQKAIGMRCRFDILIFMIQKTQKLDIFLLLQLLNIPPTSEAIKIVELIQKNSSESNFLSSDSGNQNNQKDNTNKTIEENQIIANLDLNSFKKIIEEKQNKKSEFGINLEDNVKKDFIIAIYIFKLIYERKLKKQWRTYSRYFVTPLYVVSKNPNTPPEVIQFCIKYGADVLEETSRQKNCVHGFCGSGNSNLETLLVMIPSENSLKNKLINKRSISQSLPIHILCKHPKKELYEIFKFLLENGTELNVFNQGGFTPLFTTFSYDPDIEIIELLFKHGSQLHLQRVRLECGLYYAFSSHNIRFEILDYLVDKCPDINHSKQQNDPILCKVLESSCSQKEYFLKKMVEKGVDVNLKNIEEEIALQKACKKPYSVDILRILSNENTDFAQITRYGHNNLLHLLVEHPCELDAIKFLLEKGLDINSKNNLGKTPLHIACENSLFEEMKNLISLGADIRIKSNYQRTPLDSIPNSSNFPKMVELLISDCYDISDFPGNSETFLQSLLYIKKIHQSILQKLFQIGVPFDISKFRDFAERLLKSKQHQLLKFLLGYFPMRNIDSFANITHPKNKIILKSYCTIQEDMEYLLVRQEFTDISIDFLDGKISVHSIILRNRLINNISNAEYFEQVTNRLRTFAIKHSKDEGLVLLKFIYSGRIPLENFSLVWKFLKKFVKHMQFSQKWISEKFGKSQLVSDLEVLYQDDSTKDFTILVEEKPLLVHKVILLARSELFREMFLNVNDSSGSVSDYSGKTFDALEELIRFFYLDDFSSKHISKEITNQLFDAHDFYQLNKNSYLNILLMETNQKYQQFLKRFN
ncbi:ankyrin repeat-containing protein [Anaeramoeba ignava]|uniref:Ankyrin repeat-containing protein n=1 Tax=Anaeramoeba ignava TaxID=1746090 RepID=A0A9Q0LWE7_ANAIG|nr:ankyrin repeat-containing protein [Anaeramoeba ignava]